MFDLELIRKYYSNMFTSSQFWNQIEGENILIFQTDSCLCSKPLKNIKKSIENRSGTIENILKIDRKSIENHCFF